MRFDRSEPGIVLSSVAHAALIAVAVVGLWNPRPFDDQQESVPVEVVSENELRQMMRGTSDGKATQPQPSPQAQRVAEVNERKPEAPLAQRDVESPAAPPPLPPRREDPDAEQKAAEQKAAEQKAAEAQARAEAEARAKIEAEVKAREVAAAAEAKARAEAAERARQAAAEKARQDAAQKAAEEAEERKQAEEERARKAAETRKAAEEKARREADAKALREKIEREQREEEQRKQADAERAKRAADAKRVAEERAKKAAEDKAKRELEAKAAAAVKPQPEPKPYSTADIQRFLMNQQQPQSTGATGPQPQRQAALGTPNASAPKMSPSDRESLIGYLQAKMRDCVSVPPGSNRNARPEIRVILTREGALAAPPALVGGDRAVGEAAVRGIRACAPYRIPERFAAMYDDWRNLLITIDASDLN